MQTLLAVFIGGGLGSISRYGISRLVTSNFENINPLATLISNIVSTSVLGIVLFLISNKIDVSDSLKALIVIGFCGGFSTFSTFSYEIFELLRSGSYIYAIANIIVSLLLGVGVLFVIAKLV